MTTECPETGCEALYLRELYSIIGPTEDKTLLDLCCGEMTVTRKMKFRDSLHVDVQDCPNRPREFTFYQTDALGLFPLGMETFDVALCSDGIEHLEKAYGLDLLRKMEGMSRVPIIFTPLGEYKLAPGSDNPDDHKSGWLPEEFRARGWRTSVFPGWHEVLGIGAFFAWKPL